MCTHAIFWYMHFLNWHLNVIFGAFHVHFLVNVYASSTVYTIVYFCQYVGPSPLIQSQLLMINCQMLLWLPIKWGHSTLTSVNQGFPLSMEFQKFHHKKSMFFSLFVLTIPWNATSHNTSKKHRGIHVSFWEVDGLTNLMDLWTVVNINMYLLILPPSCTVLGIWWQLWRF